MRDEFLENTCLILGYHIHAVIDERDHNLTEAEIEWFVIHCNKWFRYLYQTKPQWRKWLENRDRRIDPRKQCRVWIKHWLDAYMVSPCAYKRCCGAIISAL
jgi:hypothetical protein